MTVKQSLAWQALEAHLQKDILPYSLKQLFNNAGPITLTIFRYPHMHYYWIYPSKDSALKHSRCLLN